ncbi:putative ER to Golgi transport protein [Lineolata rhizophorae]|uniref:Putative ER to Golgi transport protein n=1 Tax=Lineolata rhizophorae TaxID=578093 RepID=A0A6A6PF74_9PEZI|nr:putative ER to Golgi transport protein [Lineolata rhizophorae]
MASVAFPHPEPPSRSSSQGTTQFPAYHEPLSIYFEGRTSSRSTSPNPSAPSFANGSVKADDRWQPRKETRNGWPVGGTRHVRQKSLSEAWRNIRTRQGSVSDNAHELADALKAPLSPKLILLCLLWYATSILSNTSSKAILNALPKPITLTIVQFGFVSSWCIVLAWLSRRYPIIRAYIPAVKNGIRPPSRDLILTTLPLAAFQIGGHILSSDSMSRIPVSLVHTIKGLSPLFTVLAYRIFLRIHYSVATYLSLVPLTLGVVMACSANFSANFIGVVTALASALLFVTQNIVSKKLFNEAAEAEKSGGRSRKPDKLNLLCYSSGLAFLFTFPLWMWSEGFPLLFDFLHDASVELTEKPGSLDHGRLALEFVFNGSFHFLQNLVAFILLSMVSPVTYSVASLIKRVFVICFAIVWFGNAMTNIQATGIVLTFVGLYLYDRTSDAAKADRRARALQASNRDTLLPLTTDVNKSSSASLITLSPQPIMAPANGFTSPYVSDKRGDGPSLLRMNSSIGGGGGPGGGGWLPPGTKQEDTWRDTNLMKGNNRQEVYV